MLFEEIDLFSNGQIWVALLTMLYVDILDSTGTLYSMAEFSGVIDEKGDFPKSTWAFSADAIGTIIGSFMGTPAVTAYIESGAGIHAGGRTGITAIVVKSICDNLHVTTTAMVFMWSTTHSQV